MSANPKHHITAKRQSLRFAAKRHKHKAHGASHGSEWEANSREAAKEKCEFAHNLRIAAPGAGLRWILAAFRIVTPGYIISKALEEESWLMNYQLCRMTTLLWNP